MSSPEAALRGMMDTAVAAHSSVPVATAPFLHLIQFHDDGNTKVGLRCCSVGATPSETLTTSAAPTIASIESQQKTMRCSHETAALNETKDYGKPKIFAPDALLAAAPTPTSVDPILLEDLDKEKLKLLFTPAFYSRTQRWVSQPQKSPPHLDLTRESIVQDFRHKSLYIFLDYDGTLTPIVPNPCDAVLSPRVRELLYSLAANTRITVGIVTGRALASVKHFVQITAAEQLNFIYAASHGFHIEAAGRKLHHRVGSHFIPILKAASLRVAASLRHIPGVVLEDNEFAVSVHYRNTPENSEVEIEKLLDDVLFYFPLLKKTRGKKVFELRINVDWDKGRAVEWLLHSMDVDPYNPQNRIVYIGDDITDEDAFRVVRQFENGLAVLVSDTPENRLTAATCYLRNPDQVADFLEDLLHITQSHHDTHHHHYSAHSYNASGRNVT